jgi:2-aminomuconate deaminase
MSESINSTRAPEPVGAYPHARRVGNLLFLSGQGPRRRGDKNIPGVTLGPDGKVVTYDIEAQVRACFENIKAVLEESGSSWDKIVDMHVFLTDMQRDFATYNRIYAEYFPPGPHHRRGRRSSYRRQRADQLRGQSDRDSVSAAIQPSRDARHSARSVTIWNGRNVNRVVLPL